MLPLLATYLTSIRAMAAIANLSQEETPQLDYKSWKIDGERKRVANQCQIGKLVDWLRKIAQPSTGWFPYSSSSKGEYMDVSPQSFANGAQILDGRVAPVPVMECSLAASFSFIFS